MSITPHAATVYPAVVLVTIGGDAEKTADPFASLHY
jgi:hypothetical protein